MRNENKLLEKYWAEKKRLGAVEMAKRANVRLQHVCDVQAGHRPPNTQLAAWLGFERGWVRRPRAKSALAPSIAITPPGAS